MTVTAPPPPERDFTRVANSLLRDFRLSYAEKGMLAAIMSHAEPHQLTMEQLVQESEEGDDAVRGIVRRLVAKGFLRRTPVRGYRGRMVRYDYEVTEPPDLVATASAPTVSGGTASGPTGSGQAATSHDLGKQGTSPGGTTSGQTATGEPQPKKTTPPNGEKTKKTKGADDTSPASQTAQTVLAGFIDWLREDRQGCVELPGRIRGQYAKQIKALIDEGTSVDLIKRGLALSLERGLTGRPSMLANLVTDVQATPRRQPPPKSFAQEAREQKERGDTAARLADALMEHNPDLSAREALRLAEQEIDKRGDGRTPVPYIGAEYIEHAREVTA